MVMPLREMSAAAVAFGKGDFTRRVPVRGHDEISELAVAFNNMATSLAESENINRSFVANVSHELKTPMTTIAGFINGILDGTIAPAQQKHYLRIVSSEVMRLSRLVQSMLNLSRIDSGKMILRQSEFDLQQVVFDTMLSFEGLITGRNISVEGMEDCQSVRVSGDADLLHQVVYNLVENAVKFTNAGGTITVSLRERNGCAQVIIRNTGAGIAQEELPLVFERFYKTDKSRSNDKNGMGLGLYIVRTIIQLHGGEIEVRSRENEYCEFEFRIPVQNDGTAWKK
jgi:signal transduction histidine kinase